MKGKSSAMSLVECVIVVSIVAMLLALVLPAMVHVHQQAQKTACLAHLRQLGVGFMTYAETHQGRLPHTDRDSDTGPNHCWFDRLDAYLGVSHLSAIKQCPAWAGTAPNTVDRHSFKMNGGLCPKERLPETEEDRQQGHWYWPRLQAMKNPSRTVLLLDGRMDTPYDRHTGTRIDRPYLDIANRHQAGANLLLLNGVTCFVDAAGDGLAEEEIGWSNEAGYLWNPY